MRRGGLRLIHRRLDSDRESPDPDETHTLGLAERKGLIGSTIRDRKDGSSGYRFQRPRQLALSALGAWLDLDFSFENAVQGAVPYTRWVHRTTSGRDQYVKVVKNGYLFPIGLPALYIQETERRVRETAEGMPVAMLEKRYYVELRERVVDFEIDTTQGDVRPTSPEADRIRARRQLGLTRIDLGRSPLRTPALDTEAVDRIGATGSGDQIQARWLRINGRDFVFPADVLDAEKKPAATGIKAIWVSEAQSNLGEVEGEWKKAPPGVRRWSFGGQELALVPTKAATKRAFQGKGGRHRDSRVDAPPTTRLPVWELEVDSKLINNDGPFKGKFDVVTDVASVRIAALDRVVASGASVGVHAAELTERTITNLGGVDKRLTGLREALRQYRLLLAQYEGEISKLEGAPKTTVEALLRDSGAWLEQLAHDWHSELRTGTLHAFGSLIRASVNPTLHPTTGILKAATDLHNLLNPLPEVQRRLVTQLAPISNPIEEVQRELREVLADAPTVKLFEDAAKDLAGAVARVKELLEGAVASVKRVRDDVVAKIAQLSGKVNALVAAGPGLVLEDDPRQQLEDAKAALDLLYSNAIADVGQLVLRAETLRDKVTTLEQSLAAPYKFAIEDAAQEAEQRLHEAAAEAGQIATGVLDESIERTEAWRASITEAIKRSISRFVLKQLPTQSDAATATALLRMKELVDSVRELDDLSGAVLEQGRRQARAVLGDASSPTLLHHFAGYLEQGFAKGKNDAEVWGEFVRRNAQQKWEAWGLPVPFDRERGGGIALPDLRVVGLSRLIGPLSDCENDLRRVFGDPTSGKLPSFDPAKFFDDMVLFGAVSLKDLIGTVPLLTNLDRVPGLTITPLEPPPSVRIAFAWQTPLKDGRGLFEPKKDSNLTLKVALEQRPAASHTRAEVSLTSFTLKFLGLVNIDFDEVTVVSDSTEGFRVVPKLGPVNLDGPLAFFQSLASGLKGLGGLVPHLAISGSAVNAGFELSLPSIPGPLTIANIAVSTSVTLSLQGDPLRVRVAFASRKQPFTVAVALLGGRGFIAIELEAKGRLVSRVEIMLEFGGIFRFDVFVARGEIHAVGGIYADFSGAAATLAAYLRIGGHVEVLGLLSISLEAVLSLSYIKPAEGQPRLSGSVGVTVDIEFFFFSVKASFEVRKDLPEPKNISPAVRKKRLAARSRNKATPMAEYLSAFASFS
jgi:hypothetical protein